MNIATTRVPEYLASSQTSNIRNRHLRRLVCFGLLMLVDVLALGIGFVVPHLVYIGTLGETHGVAMFLMLAPIYLGIAILNRAYSTTALESPLHGIARSLQSFGLAAASLLLIMYALKVGGNLSRVVFGAGIGLSTLTLPVSRWAAHWPLLSLLGGSPCTTVVICDGVEYTPRDGEILVLPESIGFDPGTQDPFHYHNLAELVGNADRILVACPEERYGTWSSVLKGLAIKGELISGAEDHLGILGIGSHRGDKTMVVATGPMLLRDRTAKRILDIVLSAAGLIALSPVIAATIIAIKWESKGPVLFIQHRVGRDNKLFSMYKFRSMYTDLCDANASQLTTRNDSRVTKVGQFIRRTSIDELPQLINVLKGDMSIVGPRPHALSAKAEDQLYWDVDPRYRHRHSMKPGITGLAQIRGYRGNTERTEDLTNRLSADLEYVADWSIWRDLAIIFRTFAVLRHNNAF